MKGEEEYSHIKTAIGVSPNQYEVALTSISLSKEPGDLNLHVMRSFGYELNFLEGLDVTNGHGLLYYESYKPILFIVTIGLGSPGVSLKLNLKSAIDANYKLLRGKNVWVPLMATGTGGMEYVDSYDTTIGILKQYEDISFTIAIPDNSKGNEFVKRFRTDNLIKKASLSGEIKGRSKSTGNITPKSKTKQTGYDDLPSYNIYRLIRDVLDKEYNLNLLIEVNAIRNNFNQKLDLADDENKAYVEILEKSNFDGAKPVGGFTTGDGTSENEIMFSTFSQIENQIKFLESAGSKIQKYFAVFLDSFTEENIQYAIKWFDNKKGLPVIVYTTSDIIDLARKHGIDSDSYLKRIKTEFNSPEGIETNVAGSNATNSRSSQSGPPPSPGLFTEENEAKFDEIDKVEIETKNNNAADNIPFHLDQVVKEDKLGREPVAKAFVDLLKKDVFTEKLNHSFMVHLQGKWGSGKSSFLNFIKHNLNSDLEKWIIVDYNAWQNQHINPPWWSLINQIYLQSKAQFYLIGIRTSLHLWRKEIFRRLWRYSGWQKILSFGFFLVFIICIIYFGGDILELFKNSAQSDSQKGFLSQLGDFGKLILTSITLLTSIYGFAKFITFPFFINSSKDAKSFVLKASDPMNQVKRHFSDLVDDINSKKKKRQLAVFIDDIDRCDKENIVCLLEGIQTLFKDKRVLYIIAGDKNWISTSFGNTYEEFITEQVSKQQLGEFFIEKAFQLSFRLPNISEEAKEAYWDFILGTKSADDKKVVNSIKELDEDEQDQLQSELKASKSQLTNPTFVQGIQDKYNLSGDTASSIVIEEKNKDTEEIRHLLKEYHKYIDTNPRSIIRLANNYTMARSILMAERVTFSEHKLFRWLVIEDLCPSVKYKVLTVEKLTEYEELIKSSTEVIKRNNALLLLKGDEEFMEGDITIEDIKTIKGL